MENENTRAVISKTKPAPVVKPSSSGIGIAGFVLSVVGLGLTFFGSLVVFGLVFAPILAALGFVFSLVGKSKSPNTSMFGLFV